MAVSANEVDWDKLDEQRMTAAFRELAQSENLRFLLRGLFASWGLHNTPHGSNALESARQAGRHQIAIELLTLLNEYQPHLFSQLMKEDQDELSARSA